MTSLVAFLNQHLLWPVLIGSLVLWSIFLWKEWSQSTKRRFVTKMVVSFFALLSLVALALRPTILREAETGLGVLITDDYNKDQLDSLKNSYKKIKVIKYETNKPLKNSVDSLGSLFVLGHGLKPFDLWQLDATPVTYLGSSLSKGISRLKYNHESTIGSKLLLNGLYNSPENGYKLILKNPGGTGLDSITLNNETSQVFRLETNLPVKGKFVYNLEERDSLGKILSSEPLPIKIKGRDSLKVLMVNNFPTFETKYLKNYLAEMGHKVLVRSQLTKNRYKFEYFNRSRAPIYGFTMDNLSDFDLLVIDAGSFRNLSSKSFSAVEASVKEEGLGLFIQPDLNYFRQPKSASYFNFKGEKNVEVSIDDKNTVVNKHPYSFSEDFQLLPSYGNENQILSGYKRMGKGRVGTTVLEKSYELVLKGQNKIYQEFWANTLEDISKKNIPIVQWNSNTKISYKDHPFNFNVRTEIENPEIISNEGYAVPLIQDVDIPSLWKGTTYPRNLGWNKLVLQNDTTQVLDYFVLDSTEWSGLSTTKTINENSRHFNKPVVRSNKKEIVQEISHIWFYLLFLLSMGYLWLEPKL